MQRHISTLFLKDCKTHGLSIIYRILKPQEQLEFQRESSANSRKIMRDQIIPAERSKMQSALDKFLTDQTTKFILTQRSSSSTAESGFAMRWIAFGRYFLLQTRLSKDRMLGLSFWATHLQLHNANPEPLITLRPSNVRRH